MWRRNEIEFIILENLTEGPVLTVEIVTPAGSLYAMAEPIEQGRTLILKSFHIQAVSGARLFGPGNLRFLAELLMEMMDYDDLVVEGAVRTSGARKGHRPRPRRFARRHIAAGIAGRSEP